MADIVLTGVYSSAVRAFKTSHDSERFSDGFIDSCNRAIGEINNKADLDSRISRIDNVNDTVTNLDEKYEHCLTSGIWRWLLLSGQKPNQGFEQQVNHLASMFEDYIMEMMTDIRNDLQDSDTDDSEYDIIGLGALG